MQGYEDPWPFRISTDTIDGGEGTDRFGWKAMPFALEDFDSNCPEIQQWLINWEESHTLVNMLGEDCMIAQSEPKP